MSTLELLSELRLRGIQLSTDGEKLRCNAPKDALTPSDRSQLAEHKTEIIAFLHNCNLVVDNRPLNLPILGGWGADSSDRAIASVSRAQSLPLSFSQQRLWFLDRIEPNSSSYNLAGAFRLDGELNEQALQQALDAIVAHHEILRTNYTCENGIPIQAIAPPSTVELEIIDLQQDQTVERDRQVQLYLHQASQRPFNLESDLMLRGCLLQLAPGDRILILVIHHIASDGWSMGIFWEQLGQLYTAFLNGSPNPLSPLPIQYADYAIWQRQWLSGDILQQQLNYWQQQLKNVNPILELPLDKPRPLIQTYIGASHSVELPLKLTAEIKALCYQEGATLYMTLLAAFQTLLYRYSGQEDFIIGSPIAGRNRTEVEGLIGLFLNTLLISADLSGNPTFQELISRVRKVALGAYSHQDIPFEKLIEELNPKRDLSRSPLFQVLFNVLNMEERQLTLTGLTVEPVLIPDVSSKFDLTIYIQERDRQIHIDLVYNTDLFTSARMAEMLRQFEYLLIQIVAHPDRQIQSYSLLTPAAQAILPDPRIVLPQPEYPTVPTLFTNWANQTPNQPAIIQDGQTWTYQELATAARSIAQILHSHQLTIGDTVAVSGDRSFGLIASMLGVLISGGVLLNLDPNLPQARQQMMANAANTKYLLSVATEPPITKSGVRSQESGVFTESGVRSQESGVCGASIEILTIDPETGRGTPSEDPTELSPPVFLSPDDSAYIFFTSGTTGVPKGVLGSHQGLSHFLHWQRQTFAIAPEDRVAQLTGLSFDVVLRDIFLPLTSGATLCLPSAADNLTPGRILSWLESQQISLLHTVPTLAQSWLMNVPSGIFLKTLRRVFFAGEPLTDTLINNWRLAFPQAGEIINLYGPTETTLAKCYYRVPDRILPGVQPVGSPLPQTQALVVTRDRQLCGIGESGEIAIRTPFRTKGYLNGSVENPAQFVQNPFRDEVGDLLYYTGDRGRYLPDGTLEILGRIDRQIKIRGVRIEPNEISSLLNQHPQIQATVVIAREDIPGDKRLVAYCVPTHPTATTPKELRQFLKQQLPDYMMPSAFIIIADLPLTANGKIDRQALPAPDRIKQQPAATFGLPRNQIEIQLTQIWEQVLGIRAIGITDNFFELGGHSLLAVRLFSEIERVWAKQLPLSTLFQAQTIEELANIIHQEGWSAPWSSLVQIQPGDDSKPPLFCVHPIGGNILEYYQLAHYLGREQSVYGLQSLGLDGKQVPLRTIEEMATHYIHQIQTVQPHGPYLLVGYSFAGLIVFEIAQQLDRQGEKVALLALLDRTSPTLSPTRPSLLESIKIHLQNLSLLEIKGRSKYILNRISYKSIHKGNFREYMMSQWDNALSPEYLNVFDANIQASQDYQAQVYSGQITLFRSQIQPLNQALSADLGWSHLTTESLEIHPTPGPHYDLLKEPHVKFLAKELKLCIERS